MPTHDFAALYAPNTRPSSIRPNYGERWFCTEQEARDAGWRRSYR